MPCTASLVDGVDELIPTFPLAKTVNIEALVEDKMVKGLELVVPCIENKEIGVVVPMPTLIPATLLGLKFIAVVETAIKFIPPPTIANWLLVGRVKPTSVSPLK